ncbi:phospholipase [Pseudomonas boanensis]|uniref:phospholipase n=1 Tax=Metapseudomonas boanensis TaxID=2822138 RepID=UPI0035D4B604
MKHLLFILGLSLAGLPAAALAWSNHALGTALALAELVSIKDAPQVEVETLESFLEEEGVALEQLLDEQEAFMRETYPGYPARPDELHWLPLHRGDRRRAFLMALRANPETRLAYFVQALPGMDWQGRAPLDASEVMVFSKPNLWAAWHFYRVEPGERLPALAVLASASDEPDYGHDINLFSDNPGEAGARYNFGPQPFGDSRYEYSSQAPFHMGYYHESELVYRGAPFLTRTYPEMRVFQYIGLARFAFESGHPYWGYRFLGWGLHYVQDLTQPYHAKALPGHSDTRLLWAALKDVVGLDHERQAVMAQVAKRHTELEKYQVEELGQLLRDGNTESPLMRAYADQSRDGDYPAYDDRRYLRWVVSLEASKGADDLDQRLGEWLESANRPPMSFSQGNHLRPALRDSRLDEALVRLLQHFGAHTRNVVRAVLP